MATEDAGKSDVDSLLRIVRAHQRQHDDRTYDSSAPASIRRCKTMLTKLRKLLPKLTRPVATLETDKAVPVLQDLCQLLTLLLGGGACPHSMTLFMERNTGATRAADAPSASGFPSYPTMATMLFYMMSFYTNERLRQAQREVRSVTLQMVLFLRRNDVYGFIHFFRDTVLLLEDCFLLEESLKNRDATDMLPGGAIIACYLDTAIHVYQDADGPLGAKSNVTLCGCMPITNANQLYERREQLKQMLPSIQVSTYSMVVTLRQSVVVLADRIVREHNAMVEGDDSFDRLCQLVEIFIVKNEALVKDAGDVCVAGAVSNQIADGVTRITLRLLHTMLQISVPTERRFIRLAMMYLKSSSINETNPQTFKANASILELISKAYPRLSPFATDVIWPPFEVWVSRSMHLIRAADRDGKSSVEKFWKSVLSVLGFYILQSNTSAAASLFVDALEIIDVRVLSAALRSNVIDKIHRVLSTKEMVIRVVRFISKSLVSSLPNMATSSRSSHTVRKRKRHEINVDEQGSSPDWRRQNSGDLHERLGQWVLDLLAFGSGSDRKSIVAISTGLRIILPLRHYIVAFVRLESFAIFRALFQRVDLIVNTYAPSLTVLTSDYLDLWVTLLRYFDDHELEKYRDLLAKVIESVETQQICAKSIERDSAFVAPDCWEYLDFLKLYQQYPRCFDMSSSERFDKISYEWIHSADIILDTLFQQSAALRGPMLVYFAWSRPTLLNIAGEDSWRNALPWKVAYRAILQDTSIDAIVCSYLAMTPLLAFFVVSESLASSKKMVSCILEAFGDKIQRTGSVAISSAIVQACGAVLCAVAYGRASASGANHITKRETVGSHLKSCQCRKSATSFDLVSIPLALFEPIICDDTARSNNDMLLLKAYAISSIFEHCEVDCGKDSTAINFVEILLNSFDSGLMLAHQAALESIVQHPRLLDAMIDPAKGGSVGLMERLDALFTTAEEGSDDRVITATMLAAGTVGCECDLQQSDRGENCLSILLRLVSFWNQFRIANRLRCAATAYDQIYRIMSHHRISWRRLCVDFPEMIYISILDDLLETRSLKLFLRTFMEGKIDAKMFLEAGAPYVLPKYVVRQNERMLRAYVDEYNDTGEDTIMADNGLEGESATTTTTSRLLLDHLDYVLKDLIIHQVQALTNKNRLAEWEFLFKFLPENMTVRDAIKHSSMRLMNLLAWELGGPQSRMAKRAMREVANSLNEDSREAEVIEQMEILQTGESCMPREYFLALMADLGSRISGNSVIALKIRAVKSIDRLLELYSGGSADSESTPSSGIIDPFVPKVMATLKVALAERELQEHAIQAWANFLRMLSTKALEANLSSIIVSLLPCLGYEASAILLEGGSMSVSQCWNVEALEYMKTDDLGHVGSSGGSGIKKKCMTAAVDILKYLFIEKGAELKPAFPKIPLLPSIPELDDIYVILYEENGDPRCRPLREYLMNLSAYVNHLDVAVREMALTQLLRCLTVRGSELEALMQNEGDLYVDRALARVVLSVLKLSRTESHEPIKMLCARCLGALGAIDGARVPLSMFYTAGGPLGAVVVGKDKVNQKIEYSTKELACALIETWLVKELRAAPENTDSIAFAIQELLKFLAELTADPQHRGQSLASTTTVGRPYKNKRNPGSPMPEWMKRRFERKDVLQFVEPYWSTSYSLSSSNSSRRNASGSDRHSLASDDRNLHRTRDDISFYEKYGTSYEDWLLMWCRRLIQLSQPPERKIFFACKTALVECPQISRFLLPYLIQNVLRSGRSEVGEELKKEIMAVLDDQDCGILMDDFLMEPPESEHTNDSVRTADSTPEEAVGEYFRRHDRCSQTIFSTVDELNEWIWTSEKKRLALSGSTAASRQTSASGRSDMPSEMEDPEKEYLEEFLKEIPSRSLSNAAYQIKAYARAIQYFEVYLRQQNFTPKEPRDSNIEMSGPVHLSLISNNAFYLQQLYKSVDEPDALIGLATLRRLYDAYRHNDTGADVHGETQEKGPNLTDLMHQIIDYEQLAQWEDALACYEQAIQEIQSALSSRPTRLSFTPHAMLQPPPEMLDLDARKDPDTLKPELYAGMIGCLIQLGRLESALQHINGIVTQEPQFMATMYPFALECSWRLSRWGLLTDLLSAEKQNPLLAASATSSDGGRLKGFDVSQMMMVRVLHSMHRGQQDEFQRHLNAARLEVMGPLAAASAESYQRAYPLLHQLHFLHEAEQGFIFLKKAKDIDALERRNALWKRQAPWKMRYDAIATPLKYRDPILALRRVILHEADLRNEVSDNWLVYAKLARKEGFIRTATSAVMHAEALDNQYAVIEKAKLLVSQDQMYEALQILEPVDIDASMLDFDVDDPHFYAKNLLLATNWMQKSGQRQGKKVIERYQAVIHFDPTWEKGYFFLAKYYEYLVSVSHPDAFSGSMGADEAADLAMDSVFHAHLINLMENYVLALTHGTKYLFQSLPRLLTLWFEFGEVFNVGTGRTSSKINKTMRKIENNVSQISPEQRILTEIGAVVDRATESLPAYEWLVCFPQVTSRICHPNPVVVDGVKKIMIRVLLAYPTQAMWPLLGLSRSLNDKRKLRARKIISSTQQQLLSRGLQEIADSFTEGMRMAEELISLAKHDPDNSQRKIHIRLSRTRTKILVPIQAALTTILPPSGLAPRDEFHVAFSSNAQVYIKAFSDKADVMMTKEKPKRIEILGTDGQKYPFLCKREKTGDLRKDARMMEFNTMINKLLQKDREGRKRKLRLRTYAVVCLNEESGLMEWVQHTRAMRQLIGQIQKTERGYIEPIGLATVKELYLNMQKIYAQNLSAMATCYRREVLSRPMFTPRFHQWFYNNFADPTAWFEARLAFSRSAAVWSMVGHIVGLGDRHGENILIDCTTGECVHVDFDCLFDKGLKLAKPEIVPFRLTPNIIDAFGITGYEGVFRRVSEVTIHLLRENKETLRSVLESFIHDPLVEWGRRGKADQSSNGSSKKNAEIANERSKETRLMLTTIDDRLRGIYNLGDAIRPLVSSSHRSILPENETLPLSVQGQVDKLIHEATSHENLAQMYIGWMPFL